MRLLFATLSILLFFLPPTFAQTSITLNTAAGPPFSNPERTGLADRIIKEAFNRLGIEVSIVTLPSERALINANQGIDAGNYIRVAGLDKLYPNLVRVPERICQYEFMAFTRKVNMVTNGWESLKPYNVGIITGWKILEKNIVATKSLTRVQNQEQLFGLLDRERADMVVYERLRGYGMIQRMGLKGIKTLEPPLAVRDMFLYLHKKHADLVPEVAAAIAGMKKDGAFERILKETTGRPD